MKMAAAFLQLGLLVGLCAGAGAQMRHDPLNAREVDQLRESAQEPKKRIDLLISFARERVQAIEHLRSATHHGVANPSTSDPALDNSGKIGDLLAELAAVIDELDDNLEMYNRHSEDLRRPLRHVLDAEADFLKTLDGLRENATALQKRHLAAALADAVDSVKNSSDSARTMLAGQIEKKGEDKNKEKLDHQEAKQAPGTQAPDAEDR